ncbi:MAG: rhodanese-like domain-containing protein [Thermodesulfovibrionales bacterium]|nr:rhodanese-like domain-containing protein [Thermodesulfovibrionales bacterium]
MKRAFGVLATAVLAVAMLMPAVADAGKPRIMKGCKACHKAAPDVVRGKMVGHSEKFGTLQINVGPLVWIVNYDDSTKLKGVKGVGAIPKNKEIAITFKGGEQEPVATQISMKQPYVLPKGQEISMDDLKKAMSSDKAVTIVDARPPKAFFAGHIPGAAVMPYTKFEAMYKKVLPKDKNELVVFYCGGFS